MTVHIGGYRAGFPYGFTAVATLEDPVDNAGIGFGILRLTAGERRVEETVTETAWLLMTGCVRFDVEGLDPVTFSRASLFDDNPGVVHVPAGKRVIITASGGDCEISVHAVANKRDFPSAVYEPQDVRADIFGKGEVGGACERIVRTVFDRPHPHAELVLGEVVNPPGKWSSYPPHAHPEAEIYHYRFDRPQGFGFGQQGSDAAIQIRHGDTYKILDGIVHSQAAAPGYAMWYSWTIHNPVGCNWQRSFDPEHEWTRDSGAKIWNPRAA